MNKKDETGKSSKTGKNAGKSRSFLSDERIRFLLGILITGFAFYLLLACISFLFSWETDLTQASAEESVKNWTGKIGHNLARSIITFGFGYGGFFIPAIIGVIGLYLLNFPSIKPVRLITKMAFGAIILSLLLSFIFWKADNTLGGSPGGAHGKKILEWTYPFLGKPGIGIVLGFLTISYLIFGLGVKTSAFRIKIPAFMSAYAGSWIENRKARKEAEAAFQEAEETLPENEDEADDAEIDENEETEVFDEKEIPEVKNKDKIDFIIRNTSEDQPEEDDEDDDDHHVPGIAAAGGSIIHDFTSPQPLINEEEEKNDTGIIRPNAGESLSVNEVHRIMDNYDPKLDLSHYKFPPVTILKEHKSASAFDNKEVIDNKENIVKTLGDHKIAIRSITATIGPTVTLYEIVPERGVRLARIKSLEDDIALNLSALGIRIIAPIPGRGTVGIEVPNKNPEMVSMRSLITSKTFQETKFDIALALGRTITNDPYIIDLTKMPHLLVAGATGQGKSVGINAIITSILYKKHPAEVKFVLIDPKRVELPLYMKIERHFLAKLPDEEDAIITDTQKVIRTLNSLCIEMDNRLELLKIAQVRNIKEYNEKFVARKLNPEKGHKYLPYIVLIIDEFADLIMTAGREIEGPIGRLAQLARAIGIHLIISTQRPSANIITGFIKANFPTRIAFRVFSSIDSRTILDATGADRLVGRGDMLISSGNEPVRVQCAFIDTPEIEELTEFIGAQHGYADAMHLPEYIDDNEAGVVEVDLKKRDPMFEEAAKLVVQHQQGSTSLIQRKLSIGYNRAGRIIDQLEAAGVVGSFEGSKAREVLCSDFISLEQILKQLE
jgi:S-DNA-T family DNA segregation ATPase FtsK/SpoIIIE